MVPWRVSGPAFCFEYYTDMAAGGYASCGSRWVFGGPVYGLFIYLRNMNGQTRSRRERTACFAQL